MTCSSAPAGSFWTPVDAPVLVLQWRIVLSRLTLINVSPSGAKRSRVTERV